MRWQKCVNRKGFKEAKLMMMRNQLCLGRPSVARSVRICFWMTLPFFAIGTSLGQQPAVSNTSQVATAAASSSAGLTSTHSSDDRYRIGPGDVLDIRVFNKPQFSREGVRVDSHVAIRMPLIQDEV